jgi:hypothetical protein
MGGLRIQGKSPSILSHLHPGCLDLKMHEYKYTLSCPSKLFPFHATFAAKMMKKRWGRRRKR